MIVHQVISALGKRKRGKEREYRDGSVVLLRRVDRVGFRDKMTIEQKPEGGDVEHLLDVGVEGGTFQAERSAGAEALRQRPFVL